MDIDVSEGKPWLTISQSGTGMLFRIAPLFLGDHCEEMQVIPKCFCHILLCPVLHVRISYRRSHHFTYTTQMSLFFGARSNSPAKKRTHIHMQRVKVTGNTRL